MIAARCLAILLDDEAANAKCAKDARATAFACSRRQLQDEIQTERDARGDVLGAKPPARPFRGEL